MTLATNTNGRTLEEARQNAREALELCIEVFQQEGRRCLHRKLEPRRPIKELLEREVLQILQTKPTAENVIIARR